MKTNIKFLSLITVGVFSGLNINAQYCASGALYNGDSGCDAVILAGNSTSINNNTASICATYSDFTNLSPADLTPGQSYSISITAGTCGGNYTKYINAWIDYNGNNVFDHPTEALGGSGGSSGNASTHTVVFNFTVPSVTVPGTTRLRVIVSEGALATNPCATPTWGETEDYLVKLSVNYDASICEVTSPNNPPCGNPRDIKVRLKNAGVKNLDTIKVGMLAKTISFGLVPLSSFTYSGLVRPGECSPEITVGNYAGGFRTGDTLIIWTFDPNNKIDSNTVNDTTTIIFRSAVPKKLYTVGSDTVNDDFRTLKDCFAYLDSIGGICDSLIIEIEDTTYRSFKGQYNINITGGSATTPIIIRPKPSNQYPVILFFDSAAANNNYLFRMTNSKYVYLENLYMTTYDQGSLHASVIDITGTSGNIYIDGCWISNATNNSSDDKYALLKTSTTLSGPIYISNSTFNNGSEAIIIKSGSGHIVENNMLYNSYLRALNIQNSSDVTIHNNFVSSNSGYLFAGNDPSSSGTAFYFKNLYNNLTFTNNRVRTNNNQWPRTALYLEDYNAKAQTGIIANNMLNVGQPWSSLIYAGMSFEKVRGLNIAHNSIALAANNKDNAAFALHNGVANYVYNNSFSIFINGYAIFNDVLGSISGADNNNYYSASNNLGKYGTMDIANISAWQSATSFDMNSLSYNPNHYSLIASDLHVCNTRLYQAGTPIASVAHDIDGDLRDPNMPCIGADEFAPVSNYSLGADYGLCPGDSTVLIGGSGNFGETAIWSTNDTGQFLTVTTPGQFAITLINQCGVSVDTIEIIQPQAVALGGNITLCAGATKTLDATITNGTSYMWSNGKSQSSLTVTAPSNNTATSGSFAVTATDVWGCVSSDQVDFTYRFRALMSIKDTIVCEDGSISLFSGVSSSAGRSFTWSGYNASSGDNTDGVIIIDIQLDNLDTVIVTVNDNGCITSDTTYVEKVFRPKAEVGFTQNGMAVFFDTNNSTGNTHFFDFGENKASSTFSNPSYLYRTPGLKEIMYVNSNRCGSDTTYVEFLPVVLSISENNANTAVSLYPNPNRGRFFIETLNENAETMYIDIMDISGKKLFSTSFEGNSGLMKEEVVLGDIPAGMYLIQLKLNERVETKRFTVN
jgi:hypothetical protein